MMKWGRILLATLGVIAGVLIMLWWINGHRIPTLRVSHTIGKGSEIAVDWIEIK